MYLLIFIIIFISIVFLYKGLSVQNPFDKVYLINLKRRPDRYEKFMTGYNNSDMKDIDIMRNEGVDGSSLDMEKVPLSEGAKAELKQIITTGFRSRHYQLTKGAIGCYLSHVKVWKNMLENNYKSVLIFEDDVNVPKNIMQMITVNMKYIPNDWDIILFGFHCKVCTLNNNHRNVEKFILLHCYAIRNECVTKILKTESLFPITQQIDSYLSELSGILNIYTVKNPIIFQSGSRTDIQLPIIKTGKENKRLSVNLNKK
jgi:GR25 family glycosyltransferase involved in LPS biosynthesis